MANESGQRRIDWEAIEGEYRAGVFSIREIAKRRNLSEGAVRKRAKLDGWQRDLSEKVNAAVRTQLVRSEVRAEVRSDVRTEREIVEAAADTVVKVVHVHRHQIAHGRAIVELLFNQLDAAASKRDEVQAEIIAETAGEPSQNRRNQMFRAVSLPTHASTMRDLAQALRHVIVLERQAFSLDNQPVEPPDPENTLSKKIAGQIVADLHAIATR